MFSLTILCKNNERGNTTGMLLCITSFNKTKSKANLYENEMLEC